MPRIKEREHAVGNSPLGSNARVAFVAGSVRRSQGKKRSSCKGAVQEPENISSAINTSRNYSIREIMGKLN